MSIEIETGLNNYEYSIACSRLKDSAKVLDFIAQVHGKNWCTPQIISETIASIDEACLAVFSEPIQGVFCSMGKDHEADWSGRIVQEK